ncbi:hypothetical protein SB775_27805 [Peribacillus sp. SIMBA_075]|uniref:hypothetical protein n=1 Tax=Peribacillus sp. SIMBA_075 TaxID=3085813 RepID=UPI00397863CA
MTECNHLQTVKKVFVDSEEYSFDSEQDMERFVKKLLWLIESSYGEDNFYREYEELTSFIYSEHADSLAFFLFTDGNF